MLLRFGVICYSAIDKQIHYQKWGKRLDQGYHMIPKKLRKSMFICGSKEYLHHFETCHGKSYDGHMGKMSDDNLNIFAATFVYSRMIFPYH